MKTLDEEIGSGLPRLRGSVVTGMLPVPEEFLNQAARSGHGALREVRIEIQADNHVIVRHQRWPVEVTAVLAGAVEAGPSPRLSARLLVNRLLWTWTLLPLISRMFTMPPYVRFHDTVITVDLADLPGLGDYRTWLPHVREVTLTTAPGILYVRFHLAIL
jgi:hypothetical protein